MMRGLSKVYDYDEIDSMRRKADIKCAMGSMPEDSTGAQRNTNIRLECWNRSVSDSRDYVTNCQQILLSPDFPEIMMRFQMKLCLLTLKKW